MHVTTGAAGETLAFRFSGGTSRTGTRTPEAASLGSTNLPGAVAQASELQSVRDNTLSQPRIVLTSRFLTTLLASLALIAMIAAGGNLYAHRFSARGNKS
jgi:hypothetical protein